MAVTCLIEATPKQRETWSFLYRHAYDWHVSGAGRPVTREHVWDLLDPQHDEADAYAYWLACLEADQPESEWGGHPVNYAEWVRLGKPAPPEPTCSCFDYESA